MATHRSRNKLERRAHMNIHNTVEVLNETPVAKNYTRDRFGKKQKAEEKREKISFRLS